MLCNKADVEEAKDEVHVVNVLNVERLVNVARCPTRVEPSIATKNQGVKEGFKWLVKSIIANLSVLGPRIDKDVEEEQKRENERREEVRKRLEEQKSNNGEDNNDDDNDANGEPPGFVPIGDAIAAAEERNPSPEAKSPGENEEGQEPEVADENGANLEPQTNEDEKPKSPSPEDKTTEEKVTNQAEDLPGVVPELEPMKAPEVLPPLINGSGNTNGGGTANGSRRNSSSSQVKSNSSSRRNSHANGMETFLKTGKMDLEPSSNNGGLKKAPFGRRLSNSSVKSKTSSAGSRRSSTGGKLPPV